jgi:hypothetical protein
MQEEQRKKTRVRFNTRVQLRSKGDVITAQASSRDISLNGLYIKSEKKIPVGETCHISLFLSGDTSDLAIRAKGLISRHDETGMGIAFQSIEADSYFHLKNLLIYNAGDPETMEAELIPSLEHPSDEP